MKLCELLRPDLIAPNLKADGSESAIDALLDLIVKAKRLPEEDLGAAREIVLERERSMSTGIGHGVAIPHGTIPGLDGVVGALGRSVEGIEFGAIDKRPVHLVVLVLVGETAYQQHIRTLAIVSRLMNSAALRRHLLGAESTEQMHRLIQVEEGGDLGFKRTV
jgi:mannitol/fructose-specific phosphotransferase system IIA component (Ntr-type)